MNTSDTNTAFSAFYDCRLWLVIFASILLALAGCTAAGIKIPTKGYAFAPSMVWDGSHFVILYYETTANDRTIRAVKVDKNGNVLNHSTALAKMVVTLTPDIDLKSNLVWNPDFKQYAFVWVNTGNKQVNLVRLDAQLKVIKRTFHSFDTGYLGPTPKGLSLVWNRKDQVYVATVIPVEHPYSKRQSEVYLFATDATGSWKNTKRVVPCHPAADCSNTSVAYNTDSGQYAVAYFKRDFPKSQVMLAIFSYDPKNDAISMKEYEVMPTWRIKDPGQEIEVVYDSPSRHYLVFVKKADELAVRIVDDTGKLPVKHTAMVKPATIVSDVFSVAKLGYGSYGHLACATISKRIHCWLVSDKGHENVDLVTTKKGQTSMHPSLVLVNRTEPYLAWIGKEQLLFDRPVSEIDVP